MKWPRTRDDVCNISSEELHRLLDGFTILEEPSIRRADCTVTEPSLVRLIDVFLSRCRKTLLQKHVPVPRTGGRP